MNKRFFTTSLLVVLLSASIFGQNTQPKVAPDHIIVAVSDLDKAAENFSSLGFTLKDGRLHSNGLLNKHIKFKDGSSLELMTVQGEAKDDIAKVYQQFLNIREGGIYMAFRAPFDVIMEKAKMLGLSFQVTFGDPFSYLTFEDEALKHVFFIRYSTQFSDPDSITTHQNKVQGIKSIWLQSSPLFTELLTSLGADFIGVLKTPDGKQNTVYTLNGYDYVIDESFPSDREISGVLFNSDEILSLKWLPDSSNHGIWIGFR